MSIQFTGFTGEFGQKSGGALVAVPVTADDVKDGDLPQSVLWTAIDTLAGLPLREELRRRKFDPKGDEAFTITRRHADGTIYVVAAVPADAKFEGRLWQVRRAQAFGAQICGLARANKLDRVVLPLKPSPAGISDLAVSKGFFVGCLNSDFKFDCKSGEKKPATDLEIALWGEDAAPVVDTKREEAVVAGYSCARRAILMPPDQLYPESLGDMARTHIVGKGVTVTVRDKHWLIANGWGGLLAVARGGSKPPVLIEVHYTPEGMDEAEARKKRVALVGKGVTFDSGGLYPKPFPGMAWMKGDMGGSAAVLGAMVTIAKLQPRIPVSAYVAATENMIDGKAYKPSEVVTMLSGTTVEIVHPDAEGRLTLADAMHYAFNRTDSLAADTLVDVATLTGNAYAALGPDLTAVMTPDEELAKLLATYGELSGEPTWRLPLHPSYETLVKSRIADLQNLASGDATAAGAITAAWFLAQFVPKSTDGKDGKPARVVHWAHWDIASSVMNLCDQSSGCGVGTLVEIVEHIAARGLSM